MERCARLGGPDATEIARFSGSVAQNSDLEPIQAMLRQHELRASVLPDIYSKVARVSKVFDTITTLHLAIRRAAMRIQADPASFTQPKAVRGCRLRDL